MTSFLTFPPEAAIALAALFGCLIGSFLNVVAHRLPAMVMAAANGAAPQFNLSFPASHCPSCETPLAWHENLPLVSWIAQRGHCRHCAAPISWRYPLLEALGALAAALAIWRFGATVDGVLAAIFLLSLLTLATIDAETGLLPDRITWPLILVGLAAAAIGYGPTFGAATLAAAAGYLGFEGLNLACKLAIGRDGMGGGDAKLAAAMGAWLGPVGLAWALLMAFTVGAVVGLATRRLGQTGEQPTISEEIPFGPWLALAAAVFCLWPELAHMASNQTLASGW